MVGQLPHQGLQRLLDVGLADLAEIFQRGSRVLDFGAKAMSLLIALLKDLLAFACRVGGAVGGCGVDRLQLHRVGGEDEVRAEGWGDGLDVSVQRAEGLASGVAGSVDVVPCVLECLPGRGLLHLGACLRRTQLFGLGAVIAQPGLGFAETQSNRGKNLFRVRQRRVPCERESVVQPGDTAKAVERAGNLGTEVTQVPPCVPYPLLAGFLLRLKIGHHLARLVGLRPRLLAGVARRIQTGVLRWGPACGEVAPANGTIVARTEAVGGRGGRVGAPRLIQYPFGSMQALLRPLQIAPRGCEPCGQFAHLPLPPSQRILRRADVLPQVAALLMPALALRQELTGGVDGSGEGCLQRLVVGHPFLGRVEGLQRPGMALLGLVLAGDRLAQRPGRIDRLRHFIRERVQRGQGARDLTTVGAVVRRNAIQLPLQACLPRLQLRRFGLRPALHTLHGRQPVGQFVHRCRGHALDCLPGHCDCLLRATEGFPGPRGPVPKIGQRNLLTASRVGPGRQACQVFFGIVRMALNLVLKPQRQRPDLTQPLPCHRPRRLQVPGAPHLAQDLGAGRWCVLDQKAGEAPLRQDHGAEESVAVEPDQHLYPVVDRPDLLDLFDRFAAWPVANQLRLGRTESPRARAPVHPGDLPLLAGHVETQHHAHRVPRVVHQLLLGPAPERGLSVQGVGHRFEDRGLSGAGVADHRDPGAAAEVDPDLGPEGTQSLNGDSKRAHPVSRPLGGPVRPHAAGRARPCRLPVPRAERRGLPRLVP